MESKRLIIIGASGLIGSSLFAAAKKSPYQVIGTFHDQGTPELIYYDLRTSTLQTIIPDLHSSDTVYILSGYSNPTWIFEHQSLAKELNVVATKRLIDEINHAGARIIFMSSVEVFDGKIGNYTESAIPHPLNVYGQMKYEIEKYLIQNVKNFCIVRTCWNVGWDVKNRCVIKLTYETLLTPNAKMAGDNYFSIIDVHDTAQGLLQLAKHPEITKCHLAATPALSRVQLAQLIKQYSRNKNLGIFQIVSFADISYSEPRARLNQLDNSYATKIFGLAFRSPNEIIKQKVALLDDYFV